MAKVFISHSSNDEGIVTWFKDAILKNGIGLNDNDIFFTSAPETGVPIGENIPEYIKQNMLDCDCVFLMISKNYKKSEVCLNEMGAAIVLGKKLFPILLYNCAFEKVGWLIDKNLCVKIEDEERLDEVRDYFAKLIEVSKTSVWNKSRKAFIERVSDYSEPCEEVLCKGVFEYQKDMGAGMKVYNRMIDSLVKQTEKFSEDYNGLMSSLNETDDIADRINIVGDIADCLDKFADALKDVNLKAVPALMLSLDAVENVLKINTLRVEQRRFFIDDVSHLLKSCQVNISVIDNLTAQIAAHLDMEQKQIQAKNRVLAEYAVLRSVYEECVERISRIVS